LRTPARLQSLLRQTQRGREVCERYFTSAKEAVGGIISTIDTRFISIYDTISEIWSKAERSVSLTADWVTGHSAILLGYDANRAGIDRINQVIFHRAAQLAMSLPEGAGEKFGESFFVLDEIRYFGNAPMLGEAASFGRTKGLRFIFAPQDLDGMYTVFGEHLAHEIIGLCGNVGVFRLDSVKTREWAGKLFGEYEAWEKDFGGSTSISHGTTEGAGGTSTNTSTSVTSTWNKRIMKREAILPSEFMHLPVPSPAHGMEGFFATPSMGAWRAAIHPHFVNAHLPHDDPNTLPFEPRVEVQPEPLPQKPLLPAVESELTLLDHQAEAETPEAAAESELGNEPNRLPNSTIEEKKPKKRTKKPKGRLPEW
jgi:Type IV secretion-system coupling protein DNA-binding domain